MHPFIHLGGIESVAALPIKYLVHVHTRNEQGVTPEHCTYLPFDTGVRSTTNNSLHRASTFVTTSICDIMRVPGMLCCTLLCTYEAK